jgi:hypothetical protein
MTIKLELADGTFEVFEAQSYQISKPKDFHPMICRVDVFSNGVRVKTVKRRSVFLYKHFTFKTWKVQKKLQELQEQVKTKPESVVPNK